MPFFFFEKALIKSPAPFHTYQSSKKQRGYKFVLSQRALILIYCIKEWENSAKKKSFLGLKYQDIVSRALDIKHLSMTFKIILITISWDQQLIILKWWNVTASLAKQKKNREDKGYAPEDTAQATNSTGVTSWGSG